ncbi:hypothetical protein [Actinomycetospora soli]|uniref:hypothetical protein n=1 Tax=Actinomycetospora soli TaxID=2893887 RepID=UPI001E640E75|nr:hypothetical protein [Actinomycetospora soli]MCD2187326.1 hypothetical protein [Actinomycetospora soli]
MAEETPERPDEVDGALADLVVELGTCIESLGAARDRAAELQRLRAAGTDWTTAVRSEEPPLIVERISRALESLNSVGGRWRRREASALHGAGMSINEIARLFGVTRQRASVLVREPDNGTGTGTGHDSDGGTRHGTA